MKNLLTETTVFPVPENPDQSMPATSELQLILSFTLSACHYHLSKFCFSDTVWCIFERVGCDLANANARNWTKYVQFTVARSQVNNWASMVQLYLFTEITSAYLKGTSYSKHNYDQKKCTSKEHKKLAENNHTVISSVIPTDSHDHAKKIANHGHVPM